MFKKGIKFTKIRYNTNFDILIAVTKNLKPNITICAVYFPPSIPNGIFKEEIQRMLNFLEGHHNVLLLGDFNARAVEWGDTFSSCRGKISITLYKSTALQILMMGPQHIKVISVK